MLNFKYTFQDGYRIPNDQKVSPSVIQAGVVEATRSLGNSAAHDLSEPGAGRERQPWLDPKPGVAGPDSGLDDNYARQATIESLRNSGKWVTTGDGKGLQLMDGNGVTQLRADGKPLSLTWRQLESLGTVYQRRAQGGRGLGAATPAAVPEEPYYPYFGALQ